MKIEASFDSFNEMIEFARDIIGDKLQEPTAISDSMIQEAIQNIEIPEPDTAPEPKETTPAPDPVPVPQPSLTLVDVRGKLADLRRNGKGAEIKDLLKKFGADRLTEVPEDKYTELMEKAEAL